MKKVLLLISVMLLLYVNGYAEYITDLDLITAEGHPTYYGETEQAHKVWDSVEKGKILFPDGYDRYQSGKTLIIMDAYGREDNAIIRDLEVYFSNCNPVVQLTIDEAVAIAATYFPHEIVDKWYEHDRSFYQASSTDGGDSYYVCRYHLTDEGSEAYYSNKHKYSGSIDIIFYVNPDGYVDMFRYHFGLPKGIGNKPSVEWNVDFSKMKE